MGLVSPGRLSAQCQSVAMGSQAIKSITGTWTGGALVAASHDWTVLSKAKTVELSREQKG